jgi:hypothetical protein
LLSSRQSTSAFQGQRLYFNNTDTNLRNNYLLGTGSGTQASAAATGYFGSIAGTNVSASVFDNTFIYISNYTSTSLVKTFSADNIAPANDNLAYLGIANGTWNSTNAITRVTLFPDGGGSYTQYSSATIYGVTSAGYGAKATGGIISSDANYWYHTFTASGTFTPTQSITADCLVVAGGGAGGWTVGGGGGAGGIFYATNQSLSATNYEVTVGAGGAPTSADNAGANGNNSQFGSLTLAVGGGGGGAYGSGQNPGKNGGSGGGSGTDQVGASGGSSTQTSTGGTGYGNVGGATINATQRGGGGGGAGAAGATATGGGAGGAGAGGNGLNTWSSWINNANGGYLAGGGGGGGGTPAGAGGLGGGGTGGTVSTDNATAGTANTGGGGGGGGNGGAMPGKAGGSGIVIVRYPK